MGLLTIVIGIDLSRVLAITVHPQLSPPPLLRAHTCETHKDTIHRSSHAHNTVMVACVVNKEDSIEVGYLELPSPALASLSIFTLPYRSMYEGKHTKALPHTWNT